MAHSGEQEHSAMAHPASVQAFIGVALVVNTGVENPIACSQ